MDLITDLSEPKVLNKYEAIIQPFNANKMDSFQGRQIRFCNNIADTPKSTMLLSSSYPLR